MTGDKAWWRPHRWLVALLLVALEAAAQSALDTGATSRLFAQGQAAYERQDYAAALQAFEAALEAGEEGPAVHYNLAVCLYRLGDYARAADAFARLGRQFPSMRGLADYNLGLALTQSGDTARARDAFERARGAEDSEVAQLASAMLARLAPTPTDAQSWSRWLDLRIGHDGNVALVDTASLPAAESTASPFAQVFGSLSGSPGAAIRWRIDASAYLVEYADAGEFDQSGAYAAAMRRIGSGRWRFEVGPEISIATLAGTGFERHVGLATRAARTLGDGRYWMALRLSRDTVDDLDELYAYVDGSQSIAGVHFARALPSGQWSLDVSLERNDRAGAGVSADRERVLARFRQVLGPFWTAEWSLEARVSDYSRLAAARDERRWQVGFDAQRSFGAWQLGLQYRYADNSSSDPTFSYERQRIEFGLNRSF